MANMSYCRFENTLADLKDCAENLEEALEKGGTEDKARARLVKVAYEMIRPYLIYAGGADMRMSIQLDLAELDNLPTERD